MAENTPKVLVAMAAVQKAFNEMGLPKDERNTHQNYNFRGIDALMMALSPLLVENNLIVTPHVFSQSGEERISADGAKAAFRTVIGVEYVFTSTEDASSTSVKVFGEGGDYADKATGKAHSFAYKSAMFQTFCIPIKGQDDGDFDDPEVKPKKDTPKTDKPKQVPPKRPPTDTKAVKVDMDLLESPLGFGKHKDETWGVLLQDSEGREYLEWLSKQVDKQTGQPSRNTLLAKAVLADWEAAQEEMGPGKPLPSSSSQSHYGESDNDPADEDDIPF